MTEYNKLSLAILEISCILHDIGKANVHFQNKLLLNGAHGDYYRHEYISHMFYLCMINEAKIKASSSEHDILNVLSDEKTLTQILKSIDGSNDALIKELNNSNGILKDINNTIPFMSKKNC